MNRVLVCQEGVMHTDSPHDGGIQQHFSATRLQHSALQRGDQVAHMEVHNVLQLVSCAIQEAGHACKLATRGVLLNLRQALVCLHTHPGSMFASEATFSVEVL